jgi:hypothetical protein
MAAKTLCTRQSATAAVPDTSSIFALGTINIPHTDGPGVLSTLETTGSRSQRTQAKGSVELNRQVPIAYEPATKHPLSAGDTAVL